MKKIITEEMIRRIQKLRKEENLSDRVIGIRFGISGSGVRHALKSYFAKKEKQQGVRHERTA